MTQTNNKISVTTAVLGNEVLAGTIYFHENSLTFAYCDEYLSLPGSYDLFPCLPRTGLGPFHFSGLGPFSDSAPDRWGRTLINRTLKRNRVSEREYLLKVNDAARQGSLRFYINDEAQAPNSEIPLIMELPELLDIANDVVMQNEIPDESASKLFCATGSLGGARPKACVRDKGVLYIAKFPKPIGDEWDVIGWEHVVAKLAQNFGINVPETKLVSVLDKNKQKRNVMLSRRFDRASNSKNHAISARGTSDAIFSENNVESSRIHYMSALTALNAKDGDSADWQDLTELTQELGANLRQLWLRAVFGTAVGNIDNHLRNHAFLMGEHGWELSPAFDINPEPALLGRGIDDTRETCSNDTFQLSLFGECELDIRKFTEPKALELFNITKIECEESLNKLESVLKCAISEARKAKIDAKSIEKIASRFEMFKF